MTIRPATPADAMAMADIARQSYEQLPAAHVPADMPVYHAEYQAHAMADPQMRWALLCVESRPVGLTAWRMLPGLAHLHQLFVRSDAQHGGHGTRLLRHFHEEAHREQPETRLYTLHCLRESAWAIRFYRRHGYAIYEAGDENHVTDLYVWIDACRRHDGGWPLKSDKALLYKRATHGGSR